MGRRSTYDQAIADEICRRLALGESLRSVCRDPEMPDESTVRQWTYDDNGPIGAAFAPQYARARDKGLDAMADQVLDIADDSSDWQRARLQMDARRWYLSKLAPKRYGDRITHAGDADNPLVIGLASELALLNKGKE